MAIKRPVPPVPLSERISASLVKLTDSAARLNSGSDELATAIRPIDAALKKLNLGVSAWYAYRGSEAPDSDGNYYYRRIGYAKVGGKWGLAISTDSGNVYDESDNYEAWLFNDAPRLMRLEAVDYIPDLLEQLVKESNKVAEDLQKKAGYARELAETIAAHSTTTEVRR
jgi:X-X-X-Leu-X-X-Gly heptad repeat protein